MKKEHPTYWQIIWKQFRRRWLGMAALWMILLFVFVGIYAPFLASSQPLVVQFQGQWYFPLFRYLFYPQFFTKRLDLFYNLLIFTIPLGLLVWFTLRRYSVYRFWILMAVFGLQLTLFLFLLFFPMRDPAANLPLPEQDSVWNWQTELAQMSPYARLNLVLKDQRDQQQHARLKHFEKEYAIRAQERGIFPIVFPSLWNLTLQREKALKKQAGEAGEEAKLNYLLERRAWLDQQKAKLHYEVRPPLRPFHWEEDAGGDQILNHLVSWWDLTRLNRKDMVASLIFGIRISLSVGLLSIALALLIGVPIGAFAGYYGGKIDLIAYRLIEIWESMPVFFMLLMVVAFLQSKSIFIVIAVIGLFGWTRFSRFVRGEFFRQKELLYVEACRALGYGDQTIIFSHLLPNAIPLLLTLIPFAMMGAMTSEAALSFLGLGEEGSNSWGVLMDEGRTAFPSESALLWPPALLLTLLLVAIAILGDQLRDALDPKLHIK